ncbi:MAG: DUF3859 domain-containing protein [Phormidesmis sp. CAN_BIN44]|nr:DUF3859 domain-containing protein [Phormidesmis sp. CAN_BIN44]
MDTQLTQTQLTQLVAEAGQLSKRHEEELSSEQVRQILRQLNLSDDLLDEAIVQLNQRKALSRQQKRNWLIGGVIAVTLIGGIATTALLHQQYQQQIAQISVLQNRITLANNSKISSGQIDRQNKPKVFYRVTLQDAPLGDRLSPTCEWIDPSGQTVLQSTYQTQPIEKSVWTTYCFYQLKADTPPGTWQVRMSLEGRSLSRQTFVVK